MHIWVSSGDDVPPHSVLDYLAKRSRLVHRSNRLYETRLGAPRGPGTRVSWPEGASGAPKAVRCKLIGSQGKSVRRMQDRDP